LETGRRSLLQGMHDKFAQHLPQAGFRGVRVLAADADDDVASTGCEATDIGWRILISPGGVSDGDEGFSVALSEDCHPFC